LLRLSALGDVCNAVPLLRELQRQLPEASISWVIGAHEIKLVGDIPGVEFLPFDKADGLRSMTALRRRLAGRRFDALLVTQRSLRANLLARLIPARRRIGYDRERSRELHGLAVSARIAPADPGQHIVDCMLSFLEPLQLRSAAEPRWDIPISAADEAYAREHIPDGRDALIISPSSSHPQRNWRAERYAQVADHAIRRHNLAVLLCGGPGAAERALGDAIIAAMQEQAQDLIGRDTVKQFLALAARARLVISPDSGPAHFANAVGTAVLGLYAATDCRRSGPFYSRELSINEFPAVARDLTGRPPEALPWGKHLHANGVMDRILAADVIARLDTFMTRRGARHIAGARSSNVGNVAPG
jgi:heptosyltransferase I